MGQIKTSTFVESIAASIQHEKSFFEFCMKSSESLPAGHIRELVYSLAEDCQGHIDEITRIVKDLNENKFPNLKYISEVQKLYSSAIQRLMTRLDRTLGREPGSDELEVLRRVQQSADDATEFFARIKEKVQDTNSQTLFRQVAHYCQERSELLKGVMVYAGPQAGDASQTYLEEEFKE